MTRKNKFGCLSCAMTGILSASLVHEEDGDQRIDVVLCGGQHPSTANAEKNVVAMQKTGLNINILGAELPSERSNE